MVYFPEQVFKNIISFLPHPTHPVAKMMKSQLGLWMLALQSTESRAPWGRAIAFQDFFAPRWPGDCIHDPSTVYKQRHAGAKRGWTDYRTTVKSNPELIEGIVTSKIIRGWANQNWHYVKAELNPKWHGTTAKAMKDYLKMNKIKGYSNKKKPELIKMCMSF